MKILSPAKVNLFLQVTGRRADGYHNLFSLMCPVGLYDSVTLDMSAGDIRLICSDPDVPLDESNLAYRAADRFMNQFAGRHDARRRGVKITIEKQIPVAAGLGGGSSNAAAVFLGLNRHFGRPFSMQELMDLGLEVGADVPFFIFGKPAIATGIGERLEPYRNLTPYYAVLIYPGIKVSTAEVYKNLDLGLTKCKKKLTKTLLEHRAFDAALHLCNDLELVVLSRFPEIIDAKRALLEQGAFGALMSGSGSTVFGLFNNPAAAQKAKYFLEKNTSWKLFFTRLIVDDGLCIQER